MKRYAGLIVAILVDLAALVAMSRWEVFRPPMEASGLEVSVVEVELKPSGPLPEFEEEALEEEEAKPEAAEMVAPDLEDLGAKADAAVDAVSAEASESLDCAAGQALGDVAAVAEAAGTLGAIAANGSALKLAGDFSGRRGKGRQAGLSRNGGSKLTEKAVTRGLDWLAKNQNADGSWGKSDDLDIRVSITSLAVLAFLGHGETPMSSAYGDAVLKGLKRLVDYAEDPKVRIDPDRSGQALLTYALAEAYAMTRTKRLGDTLARRAGILVYRVNRESAAGESSTGTRWKTLSAWNYQALAATRDSGLACPGVADAVEAAVSTLLNRLEDGGVAPTELFGYLYCARALGGRKNPLVNKLFKQLLDEDGGKLLKLDWSNSGAWPLYEWYYRDLAIFADGDGRSAAWDRWNASKTRVLLEKQRDDGRWESPASRGLSEKDGETVKTFQEAEDLNVYCTALCVLTLEVYYRYERR